MKRRITQLSAAAVMTVGVTSVSFASGATVSLTEVVDVGSMATSIGTLAGAALVLAFGIGGGFRIAHKAYRWMFAKVG